MGYSVWIGAKTEQPIQFLKCYLDDAITRPVGWLYAPAQSALRGHVCREPALGRQLLRRAAAHLSSNSP